MYLHTIHVRLFKIFKINNLLQVAFSKIHIFLLDIIKLFNSIFN